MSAAIVVDQEPTGPVANVVGWCKRNWYVPVAMAAVLLYFGYQQFTAIEPVAATEPTTVMVERTPETTIPTPRLDPLAGFTKPLSPVAMALVGTAHEDKAELARKVNQLFGTGLTECGVYIGSDGVSWSVSAVWSAGYPSPVFAGCAWPPTAVAK